MMLKLTLVWALVEWSHLDAKWLEDASELCTQEEEEVQCVFLQQKCSYTDLDHQQYYYIYI